MNEAEISHSNPKKEEKFDTLDYLSKLGASKEDLETFEKTRVLPKKQEFWDAFTEEDKAKAIAIDNLSESELAKLFKALHAKDPKKAAFIHDIKFFLNSLRDITGDKKYIENIEKDNL